MQNLVSIITPSYNAEKFISDAILSVQQQTHKNWEMLIVDDASTDATVRIVEHFMSLDNRIQLFCQPKNEGTGKARNLALDNAKGKYIAFLDADDMWKPEKLEEQIAFMNRNSVFATFSYYTCMDVEGKPKNKWIKAPKTVTYDMLKYANYIGNLTGIYDAETLGKISIPNHRKRQDWMLWLSIVKKIKQMEVTPLKLAYYREHPNSLSSGKFALLKSNYEVYRKYHKMNVLNALGSMILFLWVHFFIKKSYIKHL